jgi:hypothetical protein
VTSEAKAAAAGTSVVALSTGALPFVTGYGTILSQLVVLGAWSLVASATSGAFADQHHEALWPVALLLNLVGYGAPMLLLRFCLKRASGTVRSGGIIVWTAFYLAALFVLFPATDGP